MPDNRDTLQTRLDRIERELTHIKRVVYAVAALCVLIVLGPGRVFGFAWTVAVIIVVGGLVVLGLLYAVEWVLQWKIGSSARREREFEHEATRQARSRSGHGTQDAE